MTTRMSRASLLTSVLLVLLAGVLACNLTGQDSSPTVGPTQTTAAGAPTVVINSPAAGSEAVVGAEVLVQSTAQDAVGVTRVELRVNGFIVNTVPSESAQGDTQFSVIQTWIPAQAGTTLLEVIAYRGSTASIPAQLTLEVRQSAAQVTATSQPPAGVTQPPNDTVCRARVEVEGLNFRSGPATTYPIIRVLTLGNLVQIVGRLGDNSWWQVLDGTNIGWLSSAYTSESGDCSTIPVVQPPPSPTPRPATPTPTFIPTSTPIPGTPTPTPTATPMIPDLVVGNIIGPEVLQLNQSGSVGARYTVRIRNRGTANSGQFSTSFLMPDGTVVQLPIVANLAPGQRVDLEIDVLFNASDNYRLEATVDSGSAVTEDDESNNTNFLDVVVTNPPGVEGLRETQ